MAVEVATYIDELNETSPNGANEYVYEGDDHIVLIKEVLKNTFPQMSGRVTTTDVELSLLTGFTYLGTAAARDAGSATGDVCLLGSVGGVPALPAVDGSRVLNVNTVETTVADITLEQLQDGWYVPFFMASL